MGWDLWSEDRDFFGAGVAVWATIRIEIFLKSQSEKTEEEQQRGWKHNSAITMFEVAAQIDCREPLTLNEQCRLPPFPFATMSNQCPPPTPANAAR